MKAILLSAGRGSRLIPLTIAVPKCLVPVGGRTILDHQLAALHAAGIDEAIVVGGYRVGQIADHIAALPAGGRPRLIFNPFWSVTSSIGSVWAAREALDGPFCLMNGDTVFSASLLADAIARARPGLNLLVEAAPLAEHDDMRVWLDDGHIRGVSKRLGAEARHRSLGVVVSTDADGGGYRALLDGVIGEEDGHLRYHHDIVDRAAALGRVSPIVVAGHDWQEIDTPDDLALWRGDHA